MQLLHSSPYPVAEFATLSLLVEPPLVPSQLQPASAADAQDTSTQPAKGGDQKDTHDNAAADEAAGPPKPSAARAAAAAAAACTLVGETMTVVSPLATSSATSAHCALEELHAYLSSIDAEERKAEEEFHARRQRREQRRRKRQEEEQEEAGGGGGSGGGGRAASQSQSQSQSRRGGTNTTNASSRRRRVDPGDSLQTLETLGTDYEEDDTDSDDGEDGGEQSGASPEDKARQEEKNAEVLLAMLVAASEESKRREAEEKREKESGDDGDDNNGHNDDGAAAPEHWYERHMRLRDAVGSDLLRDDGHALYGHHASYYSHHRRTSDVRVFRPQRSGGGMALHYIVVRDTVLVGRICGLLLGSAEATAASAAAAAAASPKSSQGGAAASALRSGSTVSDGNANGKVVSFDTADPTPAGPTISAAILAVGVSGCNSILGTSELVPTLPLRFADSITLLQGLGIVSAKSVKAAAAAATSGGGSKYKSTSANNLANILSEARRYARSTLSALLLADADGIATNAMIDAERGALDDDDVQFFAESGPASVKGSNRFRPGSAKGSSGVGSKKFGFSSNKLKRRSGAPAALSGGSRHSLSSSIGGGAGGSSRFGGAAWAASAGPAEKTRILFDQYQILGVAEDDMVIPPYQARARLEASGKLQRRKRYGRGLNPLDMGPIDLEAFAPPRKSPVGGRRPGGATGSVPPMMSPPKDAASTPRGGSSSLPPTGLSPNEIGVGRSPLVSPTSRLSGPRRDTGRTGIRRAPSDRRKTSGRQQQQQQSGDRTPPASAGEAAMDPFAFNEQSMPAQDTAATFDPFAFDGAGDGWDVGAGGQGGQTAAATQGKGLVEATPIPLSTPQGVNADGFFEDTQMSPHPPQQMPLSPGPQPTSPGPSLNRLTRQTTQDAAATSALEAAIAATTISDPPVASPLQGAPPTVRFQVSVALNEDLTCSYRDSKISSCSVDGMIQVQIKNVEGLGDAMAPDDEPPPFALYLRDPSRHIRSIQENKKYAGGYGAAVASITGENVADGSEHERKYVVTLPKTSSYFPVMKYKCSNDLRPVPIVSCLYYILSLS